MPLMINLSRSIPCGFQGFNCFPLNFNLVSSSGQTSGSLPARAISLQAYNDLQKQGTLILESHQTILVGDLWGPQR